MMGNIEPRFIVLNLDGRNTRGRCGVYFGSRENTGVEKNEI